MASKKIQEAEEKEIKVKTFQAGASNLNARVSLCQAVLANMNAQKQGIRTSVLLAGDPGVGKTSFMKFFARLIGMSLHIVEAPHITEEHVINIPFITINPSTGAETSGKQKLEKKKNNGKFTVILADSNLFTKLKAMKPVSDDDLLAYITSSSTADDIKKVWEELGGDDDTVPDSIQEARKNFTSILFLDEYFRQTSNAIRNILRGILNGKIGMHDIPKGIYTAYASNLADTGDAVSDMPTNNEFDWLDFDAPDVDEWFEYLTAKFAKDQNVKLDKRVIDKFYHILATEAENGENNLSSNDIDSDVRLSPRRWEQLLLYINAALPAETPEDAKSLLSNVSANFKNYKTGEHHALYQTIITAVKELISETSNINVSAGNEDHDWRTTLEHQIKMKMKLGEHRSYIPIISGLPGVGKTSHIHDVAEALNLGLVIVDVSTLASDDATGIPLADENDSGTYDVSFSMPKLYKEIMDQVKAIDADKKKDDPDWDDKRWKYLIFFDEFNRTDVKVFNAIRRAILEKNLGDEYKFPKESIMIAAINPHDYGTQDLTGHMRDVVDVIDSAPSWSGLQAYFKKTEDHFTPGGFDHEVRDIVREGISAFATQFQSDYAATDGDKQLSPEQRRFHLKIGDDIAYVSPREYTALYAKILSLMKIKLSALKKKYEDDPDEFIDKMNDVCKQSFFDGLTGYLKTVLHKQHINSPHFFQTLKSWVFNGSGIEFNEKIVETMSFDDIMTHYYGKAKANLHEESEFVNYIRNVDTQTFAENIRDFLLTQITNDDEVQRNVLDKTRPKKNLLADMTLEYTEEEVSKVEHFIREIVHSIKIHKISNEYLNVVKEGVTEFLKKQANPSKSSATFDKAKLKNYLMFNRDITTFVNKEIGR